MTYRRHVVRFFVVALFCVVVLSVAVVPVTGVTQTWHPQTDHTAEATQFEDQKSAPLSADQSGESSGLDLPLSLGVVLFFFGAGQYYYARLLADASEQLDAIGSTTPRDEVEAADWKFRLTQIGGLLLWLFGISIIVRSLL